MSSRTVRASAADNFASTADTRGDVYVAWTDIRARWDRLRLVESRDAGRSWTRARDLTAAAHEPLFPALAVAPDGTVGMTFYDWRQYRSWSRSVPVDVWFRSSRDRGRTWAERRIGGPFNLLAAPYLVAGANWPGWFLGEYQGLASVPRGFVAVFAQAVPNARRGLLDGFSARIRVIPAPLTSTAW